MAAVVEALLVRDALVIEPEVFSDERGWLFESWNAADFAAIVGPYTFVQDNHSLSFSGVLRGLHYQDPRPQGKLIRAIRGSAYSVGVDIRRSSDTFGRWDGVVLSAENRKHLWLPPGFAHGILALDNETEVVYKMTDHHDPSCDKAIRWDDPDLAIDWPLQGMIPILSEKDRRAPLFAEAIQ